MEGGAAIPLGVLSVPFRRKPRYLSLHTVLIHLGGAFFPFFRKSPQKGPNAKVA